MEQNADEISDDYEQGHPLPISESEKIAISGCVKSMVLSVIRQNIECSPIRDVSRNKEVCSRIDHVISEGLHSLLRNVKDDAAEKLFESMAKSVDMWEEPAEHVAAGIIFVRFCDTFRYLTAYRQKFRGKNFKSSVSKSDALAELKARGLTKK